ncbi:hypothetical protein lerEdw1_006314, partial [Lerista edwardsae]
KEVFRDLGQGVLDSAWQGYNATLLAYGQTGSGKSYSMIGYDTNRGIIPVVCEELFKTIQNQEKNKQYQVTFSMLEIYNEQVIDLLSKIKKPGGLKVREDQQQGFYVDGLKLVPCDGYAQIERLMEQGTKIRTTASTSMNATSSRSHMVITIQFKQIAAISPADMCYEETLSTLRYAERTKKIKNKAVINASSTEKLIQELKAENCHLLSRLAGLGNSGKTVADETKELRCLLAENELRIQAIQATWEYRLEEARKEWEQQYAAVTQISLWGLLEEARHIPVGVKVFSLMYIVGCHLMHLSRVLKEGFMNLPQERWMMETFPYLVNVNEDPQLSGVLKYFIQEGSTAACRWLSLALHFIIVKALTCERDDSTHLVSASCVASLQAVWHHISHLIVDMANWGAQRVHICCFMKLPAAYEHLGLSSLCISDKHATFTNIDGKVIIVPRDKCKVIVNGVPIVVKTKLQHLDRIILGSNSAYLYIGPPTDRTNEDLSRYDYDFVQSELAAAEGFSVDKLGPANRKDGKPDPSVLAVFHDYIKLMPLVAEANQMSVELSKDLKLELKVKNLASSDSRGYDLQKEINIKVTHQVTNQVWVWSKPKFINRKFLMEELYQRFLDGDDVLVDKESDPFWDPVEVIHLGSAHIWLQSLAYCMKLEEQMEILNSEGMEEAIILINIIPCFPNGRAFGEDDMVIDPLELLGKRIDFQVHILQCLGVKWIKEVAQRGIQIGYKVYDLQSSLYTKPTWKNVNPKIEELVQFSTLKTSHEFLNYLQKNALIVDLWGLQEGCEQLDFLQQDMAVTSEGSIIIDNPKAEMLSHTDLNTENQTAELYQKLLKLEQETELLRDINRALREENVLLKDKLKECVTEDNQSKTLKSPTKNQAKVTPSASDTRQACNSRTSCDAEFAKALKAFYQRMSVIRGQFLKLKHCRPPEEDNVQLLRLFAERQSHMLKDFGEQLESSMSKLKNDVALIIKKKRERLAHNKP